MRQLKQMRIEYINSIQDYFGEFKTLEIEIESTANMRFTIIHFFPSLRYRSNYSHQTQLIRR